MIYTYLAYSSDIYKIGQSKDPKKRINRMRTSNPNIILLAFGTGISEKDLHDEFKLNRIKGEWFNLNNFEKKKAIRLIDNKF